MNREDFEKIVEETIRNLPPQFAQKLDNVEIVIEDIPNDIQREKLRLSPHVSLFGLYEGVPHTKRGSGYTFVLPDKITIFQKVIESYFHSSEAIKNQVRKTILHEIGHHFGMSEEDLGKTRVS